MATIPQGDRETLRELGRQIAEAAAHPVNKERAEACRKVDSREPGRPTVFVYQEPWSELNDTGELTLRCRDAFCRSIEEGLRRTFYKWRHYPGDMSVSAVSVQGYCIGDTGFGISEDVDVVRTDAANDVVSRRFHIQLRDEADIAKIKMPVVTHDRAATEERYQKRCEVFDGILSVTKGGVESFWFAPWDELVRWTGVEEVLTDMALRPAYVHKAIGRLVDCWNHRLDQYEEQGLLARPAKELTVTGAAQIFSEVSPAMHREFALEHEERFYRRFGRVYYGCCEPLHLKVDVCAACLPSLYKISMSPWVNFAVAVKNVANRFVFAWKPNPALLAHERWDGELVRADIREKLAMARDGGCYIELHLKDISTVRHEPRRLREWNRIAKEEVERIGVCGRR